MLQHLVANWLKQQAREAVMQSLNPEASAAREPSPCDIVVIFPSSGEAGGLIDKLAEKQTTKCKGFIEHLGQLDSHSIGVIEAPVSHEPLAHITQDVIRLCEPKWVVSAGFVVALDETLRKGHMLIAQTLTDSQSYSLQTGLQLDPATLSKGVHAGTLLTVQQFPDSLSKKTELAKVDALACDRQATIIAEVCRLQKLPMMAIHAVGETVNEKSRVSVREIKSQATLSGKIGAAAGALLEQPSSAVDFWHEKESTLRLSDRLAKFLANMIRGL